jgi:valyl-tRNA synthetase
LWWRELGLPARVTLLADGTIAPGQWGRGWDSRDPDAARAAHAGLAGLSAAEARRAIASMLARAGALVGEPRPLRHEVKFYEKGSRPLEILPTRQWFIATMRFREDLLAWGRELDWKPAHMRVRYEDWVRGLTGDWCISRQRYFGVPFPVWYPLDACGRPDRSRPIVPDPERLPIDPASALPSGFAESDRGAPGGFTADPDVMDTWATASLSPRIAGGGEEDPDLLARVYPMDLRPQAHEIIRTWLFTSVLRARLEDGRMPFRQVAISGWIVDPDRKKMSKSKGNALTPQHLIDTYGADGVRYWACKAQLGIDTAFDEQQMKVGRRLAVKLLNASRLVVSLEDDQALGGADATVDRQLLARLAGTLARTTVALEAYEHARALELVERSFWAFCDDYLELVKPAAYGELGGARQRSARAALRAALSIYQRLLAPYLPYVAEETWSWWQPGSVHRAAWPSADELPSPADAGEGLTVAIGALAGLRKAKSDARRKLRTPVERALIADTPARLEALEPVLEDLTAAANIRRLELRPAPEFALQVELAED